MASMYLPVGSLGKMKIATPVNSGRTSRRNFATSDTCAANQNEARQLVHTSDVNAVGNTIMKKIRGRIAVLGLKSAFDG